MNQINQIWVLGLAATVMSAILGFIAKMITQQVLKRLDNIITELQALGNVSATQEERIKGMQNSQVIFVNKLNEQAVKLVDHESRITRLEVKIEDK